jgi:hypothetical protein
MRCAWLVLALGPPPFWAASLYALQRMKTVDALSYRTFGGARSAALADVRFWMTLGVVTIGGGIAFSL